MLVSCMNEEVVEHEADIKATNTCQVGRTIRLKCDDNDRVVKHLRRS